MDQLTRIDKAWGEALVNLGAIVLRLSDPAVTKSARAGALRQSILAVRRSFRRPPRAAVASRAQGDNPAEITAGVGPGPSGGRGQRRLLHPVDDRRPILFEHALAHEQPKMIARHQHVMKGFRWRSG